MMQLGANTAQALVLVCRVYLLHYALVPTQQVF